MSIPKSCKVLVIGGGPGGSYTASALAREGVDVVVLEAEKFPRYHIGESMLPSIRYFLEFIDCYDKFNAHGFIHKNGAAFRLNQSQPESYTDFIAAGGPNGYAWNVVRSEADDIVFRHAGSVGAKIFDETKVDSLQFEPAADAPGIGRPVSASWVRKIDGTSGTITFDYLVDASGRNGIVSTRYLKNRKFNEGLKNIANWGYWKGGGLYGVGTHKEGVPYFEALQDATGWAWFIPLHNGTHSIGIVQNQKIATAKKRQMGSPTPEEFYIASLEGCPRIKELLANGSLVSDIKSASDWSYTASTYASPYMRLVGDAGSFIDPFFSSGCHLAYLGGLSAAVTICASLRGDVDEDTAASWHSKRITDSYTRFFLVVCSALKQIRCADEPVIADFNEEGFQRAFDLFRPVIQGTADASNDGKLKQSDISDTVKFCVQSFKKVSAEQQDALVEKLKSLGLDAEGTDLNGSVKTIAELEKDLTAEERDQMNTLRSKRMIREDAYTLESFSVDVIDGLAPNVKRGELGLRVAGKAKINKERLYDMDYLSGGAAKTENMQIAGDVPPASHLVSIPSETDGPKALADLREKLAPIKVHGASIDVASRHAMIAALQEAAESLETPVDMLMRFCESGRQAALLRVANQLGIFTTLAASSGPLNVEQLCSPDASDPRLVRRILRYLAASRLITEVGKDKYEKNKATEGMADPRIEGGLSFFHAVHNRAIQVLPESLEENHFQNPTKGVWQKAANTTLDVWPWVKTQPEVLKGFHRMMTLPRYGDWMSVKPFSDIDVSTDRAVFVDVGGSVGHQSIRVKDAYPHFAGRIVVQDLPETIATVAKVEGIEFMGHDFFTPQPIEGAHIYYLRSICHDWDDDSAVEILKRVVAAMAPDSRVLLDEMVLPNTGCTIWPAGQDLQMMSMFGSMERSVDQWYELVDRAGLKIVDINTYSPVMRTSIICAQLK